MGNDAGYLNSIIKIQDTDLSGSQNLRDKVNNIISAAQTSYYKGNNGNIPDANFILAETNPMVIYAGTQYPSAKTAYNRKPYFILPPKSWDSSQVDNYWAFDGDSAFIKGEQYGQYTAEGDYLHFASYALSDLDALTEQPDGTHLSKIDSLQDGSYPVSDTEYNNLLKNLKNYVVPKNNWYGVGKGHISYIPKYYTLDRLNPYYPLDASSSGNMSYKYYKNKYRQPFLLKFNRNVFPDSNKKYNANGIEINAPENYENIINCGEPSPFNTWKEPNGDISRLFVRGSNNQGRYINEKNTSQCSRKFITDGTNIYNQTLSKYCMIPENMEKPICVNYFNGNSESDLNSTRLQNRDAAMILYCKNNPNDPKCECINLSGYDAVFPSRCFFKPCSRDDNGVYKTQSVLNTQCNIVQCNQNFEALAEMNIDIKKLDLTQQCGNAYIQNVEKTEAEKLKLEIEKQKLENEKKVEEDATKLALQITQIEDDVKKADDVMVLAIAQLAAAKTPAEIAAAKKAVELAFAMQQEADNALVKHNAIQLEIEKQNIIKAEELAKKEEMLQNVVNNITPIKSTPAEPVNLKFIGFILFLIFIICIAMYIKFKSNKSQSSANLSPFSSSFSSPFSSYF